MASMAASSSSFVMGIKIGSRRTSRVTRGRLLMVSSTSDRAASVVVVFFLLRGDRLPDGRLGLRHT